MKNYILPTIKLTLVCMLLFCGAYTLMVLGMAQLAPNKGKGEIIQANGKVYYANLAQKFSNDPYFYSRPSAANYQANASCGSNKGPANPAYLNELRTRLDTFLAHNPGIVAADVPADLLTASGSGLDPNISPEAAWVQCKRIAHARNIQENIVRNLVQQQIEKPLLNCFGPSKINVLKLNLELDRLYEKQGH